MLKKMERERLTVTNPRKPQHKRKKRRKKAVKKVNWLLKVPPFLDKELNVFIQRNNSSRINFIRKSIRILCEDNSPQPDGKRGKQWLIQLHPSLHKKALECAKANYPSKTAFVRHAVTRQLTAEIYMDEKTKNLLIDNRKLGHTLTEMESDNERLAKQYYKLLADFRQLKLEKKELEKTLKKAYYNFQTELTKSLKENKELKNKLSEQKQEAAVSCSN